MRAYFLRYRKYLRRLQGFGPRCAAVLLVLVPVAVLLASLGGCHQRQGSRQDNDLVLDTGGKASTDKDLPMANLQATAPGKVDAGKQVPDTLDISRYSQDKRRIPPFKIRLVDGKGYTYKDLKRNFPTILIYFQPDCEHCQTFAAALEKRLPALADRQIILISFAHINAVRDFDRQYHLSGYPEVKIGSEGYTFLVQKYYQIEHFPFVACFNREGKLVRILNPGLEPAAMAALL